jgi:hypothetical protein
MGILRRLRGALGTTATWAAAFAAFGAILALLAGLVFALGATPPPGVAREGIPAELIAYIARWATIGALSGIVFAGTIMIAERRQTLAGLSSSRFARWGFLAGALGSATVAAAFVAVVAPSRFVGWSLALGLGGVLVLGGALGRATARATLRAARRDLTLAGEGDEATALVTDRTL